MVDTEVLIAGAGPVGLTAAIELARRGIRCRVIDPLVTPAPYAKAVGVQPRTLEVFESMGVLREILDAAVPMRGQLVYVDGVPGPRLESTLPPDVPYLFVGIPQYATERVLRDRLGAAGIRVERGLALRAFDQDAAGVRAVLADVDGGERIVRAHYLIGCDGAHSVVRKTLGLSFEGAAFAEQYMLGDVELSWSQPFGYGIRALRHRAGAPDDILVCIPLPGRGRYRVSMLVPEELAVAPAGGVEHGFEGSRKPELRHIQAVLDRLSPEPVTASNLRWSSVFRISHRIVDSYGRGRVFVAGDAAHIHPPTGAQGMNTGIQDAHNLAWKLALAVTGDAAPDLLDSYDAERRPVGEEVVGRTVRDARAGIGAGETDAATAVARLGQLLIDYQGSPIVAKYTGRGPRTGSRAPDARGLTRDSVTFAFRLFDLLAGAEHTLLLFVGADGDGLAELEALAEAARTATRGRVEVYLVADADAPVEGCVLPVIRDSAGDFARAYAAEPGAVFVVRPDGYLGYADIRPSPSALTDFLRATFG